MKKLEKLGFKKIHQEDGLTMFELSPAKLDSNNKKENIKNKPKNNEVRRSR